MNQLAAVAALATGASVTEAASAANVDRSAVYRWLSDDPEFAAMLNRTKQEAIEAIRAEVRAGAAEAVKVIREIMIHREAGSAVRLRAAMALLTAVGGNAPEPIGPTAPEDIRADRTSREVSRKMANLFG